MTFEDPRWLAAGLVACTALFLSWLRHDARRRAALHRFVGAHLRDRLTRSTSAIRRRARRALFMACIACLFAALAGPLLGSRWEPLVGRGIDVVFAIDTSRSMATPDTIPDRLARAKLAVDDLAGRLPADALGIVAFAGSAFLVCPITLDHGAFHESLNALDERTIARGGTNISGAIRAAQAALRRRAGSDKILILVTDGEDLEGDAVAAARTAAQVDRLRIYTVGVGTAAGGLIPLAAGDGGGYVRDETGALVRSRLDEAALRAIALAANGFYVPLGARGQGLDYIGRTVLDSAEAHDFMAGRRQVPIERFQWPLAASLALLLASLLIGDRKRGGAAGGTAAAKRAAAAAKSTVSTVAAWLLLATLIDPAAAPLAQGQPLREFDSGTNAYKAGRYPQAAAAFEQSIREAPAGDRQRLAQQQDAYYDLGNTLYRAGQATQKSAPRETLRQWREAVRAYEIALQLRADDADSRFNRDLVERRIEELEQQQNQNRDQDRNQNQNGNSPRPPPGAPPPGAPPPQDSRAPPGRAPAGSPPPDAMSRDEAQQLLDSAKGEERRPPGSALAAGSGAAEPPPKPVKDW